MSSTHDGTRRLAFPPAPYSADWLPPNKKFLADEADEFGRRLSGGTLGGQWCEMGLRMIDTIELQHEWARL